jgi:hypothetical protein
MFIALATGSALRSCFATAPAEPAAWSATTVDAHAGPMPGRPSALSRAALTVAQPAAPANKSDKPFRRAWMTKERPLTWNRLSAQSVLTPTPLSFTPIACAPDGARRAPATVASDRDTLTDICVARR